MIRTRLLRRAGFTLIELIVVIGIIIVMASMALLITPRFAEDQRTTRGADQLQGWFLIAKQRAYRDQQPRGLRLVLGANNQVSELIYIERPEDLRGEPDAINPAQGHNHLQVPPQFAPYNTDPNPNSYVFVPNWDLQTGDLVMAGDFLKINTYETQPYNIHRINGLTLANGGTVLQLAAADGTPSVAVPGGSIAIDADTRFQIIRQARPMAGEPSLPLPRDIVVDLDPATNGTSVLPSNPTSYSPPTPADCLDILFSQRGQVMGSNANSGKVILRVRAGDKAYNYGEQIYIVIFTRTGLITTCPFNDDPTGQDWYKFTRDGKDSGM